MAPVRASTLEALARQLTAAAVTVTGDDPLRDASIEGIAKQLSTKHRAEIEAGIAEAVRRGWLRPSGETRSPSVSVTAAWRRERAPKGMPVLPVLRSR